MKYDLHIHSKYSSDGMLEPEKIVKISLKRGLDGVAITDHNTIKGGIAAKKYETTNFNVIIGSEINTERGEIIGLFLSDEIKSRIFLEAVSEIRDQGGIVIVPHPFDDMRHSALHPNDCDAKYIDAVEILNSRCVLKRYNTSAEEFAIKNRLPVTAGSDAHFSNEIGRAGINTIGGDVREEIMKNGVAVFGKRSSITNHGLTKCLKLWRKAGFG
jgi:predicted metal-dependent phosphoesterase TrpH